MAFCNMCGTQIADGATEVDLLQSLAAELEMHLHPAAFKPVFMCRCTRERFEGWLPVFMAGEL